MPDQPNNTPEPSRPLSEISHLFLSSIRERQTNGASRPVRKPPTDAGNGRPSEIPVEPIKPLEVNQAADLTPEEFAHVQAAGERPALANERRAQITAIIAAHLNGRQIDRAREYATHLAGAYGRIGLIEVDASEFRVMLFERHAGETPGGSPVASTQPAVLPPETLDPKRMAEALEELSWDVDHWLLLLSGPGTPESRALLRAVDHWTLLATCDHDGVVSCYRNLKGLAELARREGGVVQTKLSLALLDVRSLDEADRVGLKLASVCQQFLNWPLESDPVVRPAPQVSNHLVLSCRASRDTAGGGTPPQFRVVHDFLTRSESTEKPAPAPEAPRPIFTAPSLVPSPDSSPNSSPGSSPVQLPPQSFVPPEAPAPTRAVESPRPIGLELRMADCETSDVIDLPDDDVTPAAVVGAVVRGSGGFAATPLKAPSCPGASLVVNRDRKLVLVAVARQGLCDLRDIAQAYRWMTENGQLIAMALPQFAIEPNQRPRLQLLVDQSDVSAEMLQPLLQSSHVTVQTYRKLRWGGRIGLLLEAA